MRLKAGVDLRGVQPEILIAIVVADGVYSEAGHDAVITAVRDGKHKDGSLHYRGQAFDLRTVAAGMSPEKSERIASKLRAALGPQFEVVVETDHIHVEFDPKDKAPEVKA